MVDKKSWFYIGYFSAFLFVYFCSIAYSIFPTILNTGTPVAWNTYTYTANATYSTMSGFGTTSNWLPIFGVVIASIIVVTFLIGSFSFQRGLNSD